VLVDAVYTEAMEHIEGTHPLRVTLGEVIIHRHDVDTIAGEGIEEDRECSHEGLTFTRSHFCDLALV
jgi:hypothetical protein